MLRGGGAKASLSVIGLAVVAFASSHILFAVAASSNQSLATQRLCGEIFRGANSHSKGGTTDFNRQASVREVACNGFGGDVSFHIDGGIVCSLTAAAIGRGFEKLALYVDGSCDGAELAANHDVGTASGVACGMLSDLLSAFPPAKAYAIAAGVSCAFGKSFGEWIESNSEHVAAQGVIRAGKCLRFTRHGFPLGDTWSGVACAADDPGFSRLPRAPGAGGGASTQVIQTAPVDAGYQPIAGLRVENRGVAQGCGAGSDSVGNAYRCISGHGIYDPCWTDGADPSTPAVICQIRPWEKRAFRFTLAQRGLEPFYGPPLQIGTYEPWGVELTTGERCLALQGAHGALPGSHRIIDYACWNKGGKPDDRLLLRGVDRSHPRWRIDSATYSRKRQRYRLGPKLGIVTAWYAMQDQGDALAAAANVCSASALAYAAEAYEATHGEPNGPLPEITAHACDAGYAIVDFAQEAPPPGYEAEIAFHATGSGWAFSGSADYIEAGEAGIPEAAYERIRDALSLHADGERVPF
jgi:hypothetical protein